LGKYGFFERVVTATDIIRRNKLIAAEAGEYFLIPAIEGGFVEGQRLHKAGLLSVGTNVLPESWRIRFLEWLRGAPLGALNSDATGRTRPLRILPEVRSAWLLDLVRTHPTANLSSKAVEARPFDLAANAARLLLERPELGRIWRMCTNGAAPALQPHLVIAGLGELGMQIIARAVQTTFALPGCKLAVTILDQQGIAIRTGHHCSQPIMERFGIPATARASFAVYNNREEIDALVGGIQKVKEVFA